MVWQCGFIINFFFIFILFSSCVHIHGIIGWITALATKIAYPSNFLYQFNRMTTNWTKNSFLVRFELSESILIQYAFYTFRYFYFHLKVDKFCTNSVFLKCFHLFFFSFSLSFSFCFCFHVFFCRITWNI